MGEKTIEVPLEDWAKQLAQEVAKQAVDKAIWEHQKTCPLSTLGLQGNGKPRIDIRLDRIERVLSVCSWALAPIYLVIIADITRTVVNHFSNG